MEQKNKPSVDILFSPVSFNANNKRIYFSNDQLEKDEMEDFMYVLVQTSKLLTSNMDPEHLEHLQKKSKRGRKPKKESPLKKLFSSEDSVFDVKKFMEEHNERVEEFYINQVCDLTLDEILDKISQNGMDSLTRTEKDKLDEYSKQI